MQNKNDIYWNEEWKDIDHSDIDKDEKYQISNYGRVRQWKPKLGVWKVLKNGNTKRDGTGYEYYTNFFKANTGKKERVSKLIHRLVAAVFCEHDDYQSRDMIIHLDYDRSNNYYKNLKWVTRFEQIEHNRSNPRVLEAYKKQKGKVRNAKLTETTVLKLKKDVADQKLTLSKIAKKYGISHTQLNRIRKGENWAHIKLED